ncbi:MAG TPA: hypothetical protein VEA69_10495 [Tepidisphaeraceae bacterium]|nr:hypothetical protein [Tepidisphaeraceae bacterium]
MVVDLQSDAQLLTLRQMARLLCVSADWLLGEVDANRLPAVRAGAQVLVHPATVVRILAERASRPVEGGGRAQ